MKAKTQIISVLFVALASLVFLMSACSRANTRVITMAH